jgi:hypothetical protein
MLLGVVMSAQPFAAGAQPRTAPKETAAAGAIAEGKDGIAAYSQGKWTEALEHFRRAESLYHSPVFALFAARCQRQLGQLLEARAALRLLTEEVVAPGAPAPWHQAQADARLELAELEAEVPTLTLLLATDSATALLTLDGRPVEPGRANPVNPGRHRVEVVLGDRRRGHALEIARGAHRSITLSIRPQDRVAPPRRTLEQHRRPNLAAIVTTGVGALALASGMVVGVLALNKRSELKKSLDRELCDGNRCVASHKQAIDAHFEPARDLALAADVLWISGSVLAGVGITLLIVDRSSASQTSVAIGPTGGAVRGCF